MVAGSLCSLTSLHSKRGMFLFCFVLFCFAFVFTYCKFWPACWADFYRSSVTLNCSPIFYFYIYICNQKRKGVAVAWRQWRRNSNVSMGMRGWLIRVVGWRWKKERHRWIKRRKTVVEENSLRENVEESERWRGGGSRECTAARWYINAKRITHLLLSRKCCLQLFSLPPLPQLPKRKRKKKKKEEKKKKRKR